MRAGHPNESRRGCSDKQGARRRRIYRRQGVCSDRQGPSRVSRRGRRQIAPDYSSGLSRPGQPSQYARSKGKLATERGVVTFRSSPVRAGIQGQAADADRQACAHAPLKGVPVQCRRPSTSWGARDPPRCFQTRHRSCFRRRLPRPDISRMEADRHLRSEVLQRSTSQFVG